MRHSHRRIAARSFLHEQKREGFSYDHASPENDDVRTRDVDLAFCEQALDTERRAGNESRHITKREFGDIEWMKSINILCWIDRAHDRCLIDLLRRGRLNQDSVNFWFAI